MIEPITLYPAMSAGFENLTREQKGDVLAWFFWQIDPDEDAPEPEIDPAAKTVALLMLELSRRIDDLQGPSFI